MNNVIENHLEVLNLAVDELIKQIHNETLFELQARISERTQQMDRLLDNGYPIINTANIERFSRLHDQRMKIYLKKWELYNVQKLINSLIKY